MATVRLQNVSNQVLPKSGAAHTQRTISSTSVSVLNHTLQDSSPAAFVQFNGAGVRVTFDGTAATTSKGYVYADGSTALWTRAMLTAAKAIRAASTDCIVEIQEVDYI